MIKVIPKAIAKTPLRPEVLQEQNKLEQFTGGSKISGNAEHLKWELKQNLEKEFKINALT